MNILLVGECGTGKTWVMKQLLEGGLNINVAAGKAKGVIRGNLLVMGVYDGSTFEGSDKLSMSVATDFWQLRQFAKRMELNVVAEGDRFTNSKYIETMQPYIIKIVGNGAEGRAKRGSEQTERQLKTIATRVSNIKSHVQADDSEEALKIIKGLLGRE